jgi:hypothetical protein
MTLIPSYSLFLIDTSSRAYKTSLRATPVEPNEMPMRIILADAQYSWCGKPEIDSVFRQLTVYDRQTLIGNSQRYLDLILNAQLTSTETLEFTPEDIQIQLESFARLIRDERSASEASRGLRETMAHISELFKSYIDTQTQSLCV